MDIPINDLELEHDQEDSNKENVPVSTSKSAISKRKCQKAFHELQISENLKEQAEELAVGYRFENWEHVDQVLYAYAKTKVLFGDYKTLTIELTKMLVRRYLNVIMLVNQSHARKTIQI